MTNSATEVIRRVWYKEEGVCLEIGDYAEAPTSLEVRTVDDDSKRWFGDLSLAISPEYAKQLGQALIDAAKDRGV